MAEELISVIMSVYNEKEEWLRESIESILGQTYRNLEFIIVLDNPQNETLRDVILDYQAKDTRIIFLPNEKNIGLVASLNRALASVHGDYTARMDADDICALDRLQKQMETMKQEQVDFVITANDFLHEDGTLVIGASDETFRPHAFAQIMKYGNVAPHNTWLLKTSVYRRLGGYREVRYCEDLDFVLRALQEGVRIEKSSLHAVQYRLRESSVSRSYTMEQTMKARAIRKCYKKGARVAAMDEHALNERFSGCSKAKKQRFMLADRILGSFGQHMAQGRWGACMKDFCCGFFSGRYFLMLFWEYLISWIMRKRLDDRGAKGRS